MSHEIRTGDSPNEVQVLPFLAPIPPGELRELIALDAALVDELGVRFSTERWGEEEFSMALPGKWEFSRVAYRPGGTQLAGYWIVSLRREDELHTHRVGVKTTAGRTGVGRALYTAVSSGAGRRGVRAMTLSVSQDNEPALCFYRSLGFVPLVDEELERFVQSKVRARMDEDRNGYVLDDVAYLVLRRDLFGGTA